MESRIAQYIKTQPWKCKCITPDMDDYIQRNFQRVSPQDSAGRHWLKVYRHGTDAKFWHYMICLDTKQCRDSTYSEFCDN